jgi:hypothetical protein
MLFSRWKKGRKYGPITVRKSMFSHLRLTAQELTDPKDSADRRLRLAIVMTAPLGLGFSWMPIDLSDSQVDELLSLLEEHRASARPETPGSEHTHSDHDLPRGRTRSGEGVDTGGGHDHHSAGRPSRLGSDRAG